MADAIQHMFSHKELAEALVKEKGIHEGLWVLSIEFGMSAITAGPTDDQMMPTAMIPVLRIGIQSADKDKMTNLSVDAAVVNPGKPKPDKSTVKKSK